HRIKQYFLVLLEIAIVGGRQRLQRGQDRDQVSVKPTDFAASQLCHIGILFLRHQARPGRKPFTELDEIKFDRAPDDQIFAHAGEMHSNHRETKKKFANEVTIANRIETVLADTSKSEFAGDQFAIKNDRGASERTGAERQNVCSFQTIIETFDIARKRFDLAQQVVREQNRLRALQMGIPRHDDIDILPGKIEKRRL